MQIYCTKNVLIQKRSRVDSIDRQNRSREVVIGVTALNFAVVLFLAYTIKIHPKENIFYDKLLVVVLRHQIHFHQMLDGILHGTG